MPTYAYACTDTGCGHEFDAVQSFTEDSLTACPVCSGRLRKVWGTVGVVFKGSGFYRNDSRTATNGSGDSAPSDKKDGGSGEKSNGEKPGATDKAASPGKEAKPAASTPSASSASRSSSSGSGSSGPKSTAKPASTSGSSRS